MLKVALEQVAIDRVFLIPAYIPPHKDHRPSLSFEMRKGVLIDYFSDIPNLKVLDIEEKLGGKSYTIHTIETLEREYPNNDFYFLMGTDMFLSFERWFQFEELLKRMFLVVGSREVGDKGQLLKQKQHLLERFECKGIILCDMEPIVCASSAIKSEGDGLVGAILKHIGSELDAKRARHTMQVADYAAALAEMHGADRKKAYLAGLLHDCTKCYSEQWHREYAAKHNILLTADDLACPQVLHQITAPCFARETFGVTDEEVLSAIGCHTTGKVNMSTLDMLLFFADSCEPSRDYPTVDAIRKVGERNLKAGALMLIRHVIAFLKERNAYLHPQTEAARDDLIKELEKNE